jgi:hypothetical protein
LLLLQGLFLSYGPAYVFKCNAVAVLLGQVGGPGLKLCTAPLKPAAAAAACNVAQLAHDKMGNITVLQVTEELYS